MFITDRATPCSDSRALYAAFFARLRLILSKRGPDGGNVWRSARGSSKTVALVVRLPCYVQIRKTQQKSCKVGQVWNQELANGCPRIQQGAT
eukprot:scaffold4274_cov267-Pinguiococcus_pyrenoidosus.AAC.5